MNSDVRNQISPDHTMYNYWLQKLIHLSNREINSGSFALGKKRSQQLNGRKVFSSITDNNDVKVVFKVNRIARFKRIG